MAKLKKRGRKALPLARRKALAPRPISLAPRPISLAPVRGGGERFELAMRAINEGVYDWDVASGAIYYSEAVYSVLHMPRSVKTPAGWRKRIHPDDLAAYDAALVAHFKKKTRRFECDYRYQARDRTWRWARQHGIAQRDARGRVVRMIGSTGDITELKRVELALAESRERYALATWAATEGIYEWNLVTGSLFLSDRAKAFFGVKGAKLTPAAWNARVHRDDFPAYRAALAAYFKGRTRQFEHEYRIRDTKGGYAWVVDRAAAVRDEKKKVVRLVGALADVTQRKLNEIELRRARDEATEALERQTATSEVLKTISRSTFDLNAVLQVLIENGTRLAGANQGFVFRFDGRFARVAFSYNARPAYKALIEANPIAPGRGTLVGRTLLERRPVHIPDVSADREFKWSKAQRLGGFRSMLGVPMLREGNLIGVIAVWSEEVRAFSQRQIELVSTFADQAVIAIENVRLFNETKEALERQTATGEILASISNSMADAQPVFDAIARNVLRILGTHFSAVQLVRDGHLHLAGFAGPWFKKLKEYFPQPLDAETAATRALKAHRVVQLAPIIGNPKAPARSQKMAKAFGYNAIITVPMMRGGKVVGAISTTRREAVPFDEKQEALLKAFADQAVIAIENARLFNETREALERQTATAEILKVIASSPSDVQPVFDAVVKSALRLVGGYTCAVTRLVGDTLHLAAFTSIDKSSDETVRALYPFAIGKDTPILVEVVRTGVARFFSDVFADPGVRPVVRESARERGYRSLLFVPMLRGGVTIGLIHITRVEPGAFADHQIELLKTFADQAVIAIENVRLFNETKEALERQTASSEVLRIVAGSMADAQPVFEAILASTLRLFEGFDATVWLVREGKLVSVVRGGATLAPTLKVTAPITQDDPYGAVVLHRKVLRLDDIAADPGIPEAARVALLARSRRSVVMVPLIRDGEAIGALSVSRTAPYAFKDTQVALLANFADQAVIAIENVRLFNETKEALERQTATAEILRVIGGSMTDAQPVFDAIVKNGGSLFKESRVSLWLIEGDQVHTRASTGESAGSMPIDRGSGIGACVLDGRVIHLPDLEKATAQYPRLRQLGLKFGYHSGIYAPLLRDGRAIGGISVLRREAGAFNEKEVELLNTFADQAVIAIENVRLFNELEVRNRDVTEALEQQRATADVLASISGSMTDTQPVFDAIVRNINRLFGTRFAVLQLLRGTMVEMPAVDGAPGFERLRERYPRPLDDATVGGLTMLSKQTVRYAPVIGNPAAPPATVQFAKDFGFDSVLFTPMIHKGKVIGAIGTGHPEPKPFDERQVALIKTFADQAVIAIENVRLFNETREALERQTATAEILKVIASSPADVQPVFDAIVQTAKRLIGAFSATVTKVGDGMLHLVAHTATTPEGAEALNRFFPILVEGTAMGRAIQSRQPAFIDDFETDPKIEEADRDLARLRGFRSVVFVPLMRGGVAIGSLNVTRREAGRLSDHQVGLLKTFADQAVIAIENVRLFNETKEALEQQTATAEILKAISNSPTDVQPVFEAIVRSGVRLFKDAAVAVTRPDGDVFRLMAIAEHDPELAAKWAAAYPTPVDRTYMHGAAILDCKMVEISDALQEGAPYPEGRRKFAQTGYRAITVMPMVRDGICIGTVSVVRVAPGPLSEKQNALLRTFADQAVIAIENVRLFNETKEALERQTATAEILKVISQSTTDVQPVLEAIVGSAAKLFPQCNAFVFMRDGELVRLRAMEGLTVDDRLREDLGRVYPVPFDPEVSSSARAMAERRPNACTDTEAPDVPEHIRRAGRAARFRSNIVVPLVRDDEGIGSIVLTDTKPGYALDGKQLSLLQTFADQAVIAIENVRLFNETKEALERQTATAEILKVIASSPSDVQPVFDAIAASALRLIGGRTANVTRLVGDELHLVAFTATSESLDEEFRKMFPSRVTGQGASGRAVLSGKPATVSDFETDAAYSPAFREVARARGMRSVVAVPMIREGEAIGTISVARSEAGNFTDHQIDLLKTFADQAVIAIENVRLFNETREALERQTATAEILKVISSSPTDTQPVFEAIVQSGLKLFPNSAVVVTLPDGDQVRLAAMADPDPVHAAQWKKRHQFPLTREFMHAVAILDRMEIDVPDAQAYEGGPLAAGIHNFLATGNRAITIVPMLRPDAVIGTISVIRLAPGPLTEKQFALLRTFADQAVIAIENVRLFKELQSRTDALTKSVGQLTALGEVGQAISSTLDLDTVLQTIVSRAVQLTGLNGGTIYEFDERRGEFLLRAHENMPAELVEVYRSKPIRLGEGVVGSAAQKREALQVPDIQDPGYQTRYRDLLIRQGYRAILAVPLLREEQIIGALTVSRNAPGEFPPEIVELLKTFATQSAMAIQNARLFREIAEKGKQLELASQHKSNFLASMSHELRTPLNAILGFNEMILGQVYGEVPADMQEPLNDIQTSGKHLLRLINNVLDLAKIEAGRMELSLQDYSVHDTVGSVHSTLRPLAADKGLEFLATVPNDVPLAYGDGGRITQCLMNLAGNSIKFTKAGKVEISAEEKDGLLTYRVADTGIGIPPDKIDSLFTEFKQTDATIASEYGGTGLGLSISKKFVEMHGGRIWIESELGKGSTFIIEVPLRVNTK